MSAHSKWDAHIEDGLNGGMSARCEQTSGGKPSDNFAVAAADNLSGCWYPALTPFIEVGCAS